MKYFFHIFLSNTSQTNFVINFVINLYLDSTDHSFIIVLVFTVYMIDKLRRKEDFPGILLLESTPFYWISGIHEYFAASEQNVA